MPLEVPATLLGMDGFRTVIVPVPPPHVYYVPVRPGTLQAMGIRGRTHPPLLHRRFVRDPLQGEACYIEVTHVG